MSTEQFIYRIKPIHYIHVTDTRTNSTRLITGPLTFTRQDNETVVFGPEQMIIVPPRHYATIANPVIRDKNGNPTLDKDKNFKLRFGSEEIRWEQEPFPLYPGEKIVGAVTPLSKWIVPADSALRLRALRDFTDAREKLVFAGQEWLFLGPGTYAPRVEVSVIATGRAYVIKPHTAVRVRAWHGCTDSYGTKRKVGEEWLVREPGAYILRVYEEFVAIVTGHVLTEHTGLHLRATRTSVDILGRKRKAGEEWLVTVRDAESYVCDVYEELVEKIHLTTLNSLQYCVVLDPYDEAGAVHRLGQKEVRRGICSFFLRPGERLEGGIQAVHVLAEDEALLMRAREEITVNGTKYAPGDRWMIHGPTDCVPPVQVEIVERRKAIPLDTNEGIYVRDVGTGKVRLVTGQSYILPANEELWLKELPKAVEELLAQHGGVSVREKSRAVSIRMPYNTVMQVYDYKEKKQRVVWGPELVMLGPDEQFSVLSLSGDKPKRPHVIKALWLNLGPEFMTDIVTVETTDHARLSLKMSYTWNFEVKKSDPSQYGIFQVPDFVGDSCKAIASKIRTAVAASSFDAFHKNFARIIRTAVFGTDASGKYNERLFFEANRLAVTSVDIQSVEPIDQRTRDSLMKSVQLAIEITTKSQEAVAKHEADRLEQEAKALLEREKLGLESAIEKSRKGLKEQQALNTVVESSGHATADAKARAAASEIDGQSSVKIALLRAEAGNITATAGLSVTEAAQEAELKHIAALNSLEVTKKEDLSQIEASKFKDVVDAIGSATIAAIARAGPEMQAKLLKGLGLKSLLVTDGHTPVNLFNTASGLIAPGTKAAPAAEKVEKVVVLEDGQQ